MHGEMCVFFACKWQNSRGEDKNETEIVTSARKKSEKSGKNKSQRRPNEHGSKYAIMLFIFSYKSAKQGKETNKNPLSYHGNKRGKCKKKIQKPVFPHCISGTNNCSVKLET